MEVSSTASLKGAKEMEVSELREEKKRERGTVKERTVACISRDDGLHSHR